MENNKLIRDSRNVYYKEIGRSLYDEIFIFQLNGKFGLQNIDFKEIIPANFEEIELAYKEHFWGKMNDKWQLYNFGKQKIIDTEFTFINEFFNEYACVSKDGQDFGFINRKGNRIITEKYIAGKHLGSSLFAVGKIMEGSIKYGIIDLQENTILPYTFSEIPTFTEVVLLLLKSRKPLREWLQL